MPNIVTVYNSGLDALANLFEVNIPIDGVIKDFFGESIPSELIFRIQDFAVPSSSIDTYSIEWGTWSIDRPNGKVNTTREITFNIRIDKAYAIYQGFINWKNAISNEYTGVISDVKDYVVDIPVYPVSSTIGNSEDYILSTVGQGAKFEKCWPKEVGEISYDQSSGEPLALSVTFSFLRVLKDFNTELGSSEDVGASTAADGQ